MGDLVAGAVGLIVVAALLLWYETRQLARTDELVRVTLEHAPSRWWTVDELLLAGCGTSGRIELSLRRLVAEGRVERKPMRRAEWCWTLAKYRARDARPAYTSTSSTKAPRLGRLMGMHGRA